MEKNYGKFYPLQAYTGKDYVEEHLSIEGIEGMDEKDKRYHMTHNAFEVFYTTRFVQKVLRNTNNEQFNDFINFDITSVTNWDQLAELDEKLCKIINSPEIYDYIDSIMYTEKGKEIEKEFYDELRKEVDIEIKKDSDRIENAYSVFRALETGEFDTLFEEPETAAWLEEAYERERNNREVDED